MPDILVTDDGPVRTIRMNRPQKKNALTHAMYEAMAAAIEDAGARDVRCLLVTGTDDAFCAGNDLGDFLAASRDGGLAPQALRFLHTLARNQTPMVAAVAGPAVGIGTTMLMHCDHVVAADTATLSTPFLALGLIPEAASTLLAPRLMGHARAFSLLAMGEALDAQAARAAGLVNAVVPAAELEASALARARKIAALPPEALRTARTLMRGPTEEIVSRIDREAAAFRERLASPEAQAAFEAFLSRKK